LCWRRCLAADRTRSGKADIQAIVLAGFFGSVLQPLEVSDAEHVPAEHPTWRRGGLANRCPEAPDTEIYRPPIDMLI